jgi:hypothetical protein
MSAMPIYEYRCECGARLESIERVGAVRERCGDLCAHPAANRATTAAPPASAGTPARPAIGEGQVERQFSTGMIRGDGREAREPTFDPCKQSNRPGGGCDGNEY